MVYFVDFHVDIEVNLDTSPFFENASNPLVMTGVEGQIIDMNFVAREMAGFKSHRSARDSHYSEIPIDISEFSKDFIAQDQRALQQGSEFRFLSVYRYSDGEFHAYLGNKKKIEINQSVYVLATYSDISSSINPFTCELACLYANESRVGNDSSFWYPLDNKEHVNSSLTGKEISCIRYLTQSFTNKLIASALNISVRTVEMHFSNIKEKLGLNSKSEIVSHCIKNKLISLNLLLSN